MPLNIRTNQPKGGHVKPGFCDLYRQLIDEPLGSNTLSDLIFLMCTALDEAAVTDDTCIIFGSTRKRDAFSVTVKFQGRTDSEFADSPEHLAVAVGRMLV